MTSNAIDSAAYKLALILESSTCGFLLFLLCYKLFPWITGHLELRKNLAMKILSLQSVKKNQIQKWGKRIASTESAITLGNAKGRRLSFSCCCGLHVLKKLVLKFRTKWKQALGWQRSSIQYSYDLYSYSLNFDDGLCHGHHPSKGSQ